MEKFPRTNQHYILLYKNDITLYGFVFLENIWYINSNLSTKEEMKMSFYSVDIFYAVKDIILSIWG